MRKMRAVLAATAIVACVAGFVPAAYAATALKRADVTPAAPAKLPTTTGDVTVAYYAAGGEAKALATTRGKGAKLERRSTQLGVIVVDPPAGVSAEKFAEQMAATPGIRYAEPVRIVRALYTPNDTYFKATSVYPDGNQWGLFRIHMQTAWEASMGDPSVKVAVVDTGFDLGTDDEPVNIDTVNDRDFSVDPPGTTVTDGNGHGTHVTGIIAAETNNSLGFAGVAPNVTILPIKALADDGTGTDQAVADGIRWAVDQGADVISLSLGTDTPSTVLENEIDYAISSGCVVVAAAGNEAASANYIAGDLYYPAAYPAVIAVGAIESNDTRASFSQYGPNLDLVAPGVDIWSLWPNNRAFAMQGTSQATPYVSGVAALLLSEHPGWTAAQVETALTESAEDLGVAGRDNLYGYGLVRADSALGVIGTSIGIAAAPTTPAWGGSTQLSGVLSADGSPSLPGREISIERKPYGSPSWSEIATAATDGDGLYHVTVTPTRQTAYRARWVGEGAMVQATSTVKTVTPKAYLTSPTVPQKVLVNNFFTSYGYLRPRHTKGSESVKVKFYLWNSAAREYRYHHYVWAVNQDYASWTPTTKYVARYKLPHRGKWKLYAGIAVDGDNLHAETYSAPRFLTVR